MSERSYGGVYPCSPTDSLTFVEPPSLLAVRGSHSDAMRLVASAAFAAEVDRVLGQLLHPALRDANLRFGSPQPVKSADYTAKLVVRGGSNRRPSAFQAHTPRRCMSLSVA
jgi:hypothetical protein